MEPFRGIAIGIDRYCHLPPLNHAEADAQACYRALHYWGGIPHAQLLLLGDTSPKIGDRLTTPQQATILHWLGSQTVPVERYWFFFKGYGANYRGDDYLMPIDSDPNNIAQSGILVRSVFDRLQQLCNQKLLILLDLSRLPEGNFVGEQTLRLAQQKGIALILACHTASSKSENKQQLWVNALLEALRYYRQHLTLAQLDAYFRDRLSEGKTPIVISPNLTITRLPLLPTPQKSRIQWQSFEKSQIQVKLKTEARGKRQEAKEANFEGVTLPTQTAKSSLPQLFLPPTLNTHSPASYDTSEEKNKRYSPLPVLTSANQAQSRPIPHKMRSSAKKANGYWWWLFGTGAILLMAVLGWQWWMIKPSVIYKRSGESNRQILLRSKANLRYQQASQLNQAISIARQIPKDAPLYQEAQADITRWSHVILDIAYGRATNGDLAGAIAAAQLVPADRTSVYPLAQQAIKDWQNLAQQQQDNQVLIKAAKALIQRNRASSYNQAIATVRRILPGEPAYAEARKLREQWSDRIYQLARMRAAQGKLSLAIQTAQLVPEDSAAYLKAQTAIAGWQQALRR